MNTTETTYETYRLDHLGIVAGICEQIKLVETIDELLPNPSGRHVSCGQATYAMVLNAMGLNGRALYLTPEFMANKPVEHLFGEGYKASDFNDDALGRSLDELHQAGVTELFASIAQKATEEFDIEHEFVHVDTTSLSVTGEYADADKQWGAKVNEVADVTYGHSKANRPDLKQVVVSLITSQQSSLPLWLEVLDGNSSDKKSFQPTIQAYCKQLSEGTQPWFIMDSAGYSQETLPDWGEIYWLTRVPETSQAAKEALHCVETENMEWQDENYRTFPLCSIYGGVKQRWLVVYSQNAYESESKALDIQVERAGESAEKALKKLSQQRFSSKAKAQKAVEQFQGSLKWHTLTPQFRQFKRYEKAGRPAQDAKPVRSEWQIEGTLHPKQTLIDEARQWKGRFMLATNILDSTSETSEHDAKFAEAYEEAQISICQTTPTLTYEQMLPAYKTQSSSVERGFRFLKDPMFFADNLFLKNCSRIMAMIMVMGLALLVYSLAELQLRRQLKAQNETIPHQTGRPTQSVTMRRIAQIFEGIDFLVIRHNGQVVQRKILNLNPVRLKIISLLGPLVAHYYLVPT